MKLKIFVVLFFIITQLKSQNHWKTKTGFTMEYGNVPAWAGLVDLRVQNQKAIYIFDDNVYHGHSNFVLRKLKHKVTFSTFKELVKYPEKRQYIPFNLYDLRKKEFTFNNQKYKWAIKMCDYVLQDNPQEMIKLITLTYNEIYLHLKKIDTSAGPGIILLSNSETATPNTSSLEDVKTLGYSVCGLKEFYNSINYHPKTNSILNEGKTTGYLKYIEAGQENNVYNNENTIYVFENTPERVPLAAGFITLQPQTFLSHINLLAINRKTPNASTSDKSLIQQLKNLNGKVVSISFIKENQEIKLEKIGIDFIPKIRITKTSTLLEPDTLIRTIVSLSDSTILQLKIVGAKAANYGLIQKKFPEYVKKGFAIPFYFYYKVVNNPNIKLKINALDKLDDTAIVAREKLEKEIQGLITKAPLPVALFKEIKTLQQTKFFGKKFRIRSSTNCEDLPEFNGAGLYISKGIKPDDEPEEFRKKIMQVYASMFSANACGERNFFGIKNSKAAMAILINEAYENEWANGVALTVPSDSVVQLVINAQPGEHEVTNPVGGDVPEELFYSNINNSNFLVTSRSNYGRVFTGTNLTKNIPEQIRTLCIEIEKLLKENQSLSNANGYGVDIEFKITYLNGKPKLFIKQARLLNFKSIQ